ncbi:hypothetical protein MRX96_052025 [Rhipicephalus microplus]
MLRARSSLVIPSHGQLTLDWRATSGTRLPQREKKEQRGAQARNSALQTTLSRDGQNNLSERFITSLTTGTRGSAAGHDRRRLKRRLGPGAPRGPDRDGRTDMRRFIGLTRRRQCSCKTSLPPKSPLPVQRDIVVTALDQRTRAPENCWQDELLEDKRSGSPYSGTFLCVPDCWPLREAALP